MCSVCECSYSAKSTTVSARRPVFTHSHSIVITFVVESIPYMEIDKTPIDAARGYRNCNGL